MGGRARRAVPLPPRTPLKPPGHPADAGRLIARWPPGVAVGQPLSAVEAPTRFPGLIQRRAQVQPGVESEGYPLMVSGRQGERAGVGDQDCRSGGGDPARGGCCPFLFPHVGPDVSRQGPVSLGRTTTRPGETPSSEPILIKFFFLLSGMVGQRRCIDRGGYIDDMGYASFAGILGNRGGMQKRG